MTTLDASGVAIPAAGPLAPLALALRLFGRYWPQLILLAALGVLLRDVLLTIAVEAGLANPLAGMIVLSLVVLVKLVVVVLMFSALRPDMPATNRLRHPGTAETTDGPGASARPRASAIVAVAILPFFAYYAAWGFLGDTVREYSRLALAKAPFGEQANVLDLLRSQWLVASIVALWVVRWAAKRVNRRAGSPLWTLLIVACDASWIFIGLYAIGVWKDEVISWIGSGEAFRAFPALQGLQAGLGIEAWAAEPFVPVEFRDPGLMPRLQSLFFFALLPLVWLVMAAIICGYEVSPARSVPPPATRSATAWSWLRDFIGHFINGYRNRYMPVLRCVRMVLGAGIAPLVTLVLAYQLISWAGAWLWVFATRTIGAHDLPTWQVMAEFIGLLIGSPSDLDGGILLDPLRVCLLAATVERAIAMQMRAKAR